MQWPSSQYHSEDDEKGNTGLSSRAANTADQLSRRCQSAWQFNEPAMPAVKLSVQAGGAQHRTTGLPGSAEGVLHVSPTETGCANTTIPQSAQQHANVVCTPRQHTCMFMAFVNDVHSHLLMEQREACCAPACCCQTLPF